MILLVLAVICLGAAIYLVGQLITQPAQERRRFIKHVSEYGNERTKQILDVTEESLKVRFVVPVIERFAKIVLRINPKTTTDGVAYRLVSAGVSRRISPTTFLALKGILPLGLGLLGFLIGQSMSPMMNFAMVLGGGALGFILPDYVVNSKIRSRQEAIRAQLPDALDLLAVSVEAGLGFDSAVTKLIESLEGPLIDEFNLTLSEIRVGESRPEALRKLSERAGVSELSAFTRALIQADTLGISLGRILRVQAADAREKRQLSAEERAMKAPIKMLFPTVLFIFPSMFIVTIGPAFLSLTGLFGGGK
jgi:tight adherence protein C